MPHWHSTCSRGTCVQLLCEELSLWACSWPCLTQCYLCLRRHACLPILLDAAELTRRREPPRLQVPIAAADEISSTWMQRAFCKIHHPLCPSAMSRPVTHCLEGEHGRGRVSSSQDGGTSTAAKIGIGEAVDARIEGELPSSCDAPVPSDRACGMCPDQLKELYLAVADSEGSVLVYRIPRASRALLSCPPHS